MTPKPLFTEKEREEDSYFFKLRGIYFEVDKTIPQKRSPKRLRFSRIGRQYSAMENYFSKDKIVRNNNREIVNEKKYLVGDTGIDYRTISYWAENDVLPEGIKLDGWKKFSLVELVWMRAVEKMRDFGLQLNEIAEVKYWVMQWDEKNNDYPWFEFYVVSAALTPFDPYIVVLPLGIADLATTENIEDIKIGWNLSPNIGKSMLLISLKEILKELDFEVKSANLLKDIHGLDREIYDIVHFNLKKYKEVTIRLKREGGVSEIIKSKTYANPKELDALEKERIENPDFFADVVKRYSNGKVQSVEVIEKKRV